MVTLDSKLTDGTIALTTPVIGLLHERMASHMRRMDKPMGEYISAGPVVA